MRGCIEANSKEGFSCKQVLKIKYVYVINMEANYMSGARIEVLGLGFNFLLPTTCVGVVIE
jgi:hypothetical protein